MRPLLLCAALAALASVRPAGAQSCTTPGAAAVPDSAVGGLASGPHTLVANGVRLWYCAAGNARRGAAPVVFLHGGPGEGSFRFAALAGAPLERSLRMVYLDQRGSGRSERPWTGEYAMAALVEDVEAVRRALGVPRIAIMAHSFGVAIALEYAARYPDHVWRMVLAGGLSDAAESGRSQCQQLSRVNPQAFARAREALDSAARADPRACDVFRALPGQEAEAFFHANMFPDPASAARVARADSASGHHRTGEIGRALFAGGLARWRFSEHARLTMPVLVLAGALDHQVGMQGPRDLVRLLPNARLVVYPRSGHFVYVDDPERFTREVTEFLAP